MNDDSTQDVRALLRRLEPTQCRVLQMLYFERSTPEEIAERLRISRRSVTRKSAAGMQALALLILAPTSE